MEFPKSDVGGQESGAKARAKCGGFTRARGVRQPRPGHVLRHKPDISSPASPDRCLLARLAYLWVMTIHFPFQNTYTALPANFFARVAPTPVAAPRLIKLNRPLAVQ